AWTLHPRDYLVILQDREEAAYFLNDLQNLLEREILLFPMSYKRPYEFSDVENANILMRAEVLNRLASKRGNEVVVTYPDALGEKVINKRSLANNTFTIRMREKLDLAFLEDFLHSYDFEKRSEEHTSELQSRENLVCRLLLEKKKKKHKERKKNKRQ